METPEPPALNYAPRTSGVRRRRMVRLLASAMFAVVVLLAVRYQRPIGDQIRMLYWQRQCMSYLAPPSAPTTRNWNSFRTATGSPSVPLPAALSAYARYVDGFANWAGVPIYYGGPWQPLPDEVVMMHERVSPAGHRRLVIVSTHAEFKSILVRSVGALTVKPGSLLTTPTLVGEGDGCTLEISATAPAAWIDPVDGSHFQIKFRTSSGAFLNIDGRLGDDEIVKFTIVP